MKRLLVFLFVISLFAHNTFSESENYHPQWTSDELGEFVITPMKSAPFPHPSRMEGYKRGDTFYPAKEHYQDSSVGILIPSGYKKTEKVDIMVHSHGHGNNVAKQIAGKKLREMLDGSGKNVIMIVPQGPKNAGDSSFGKIEDKNGLKNLMYEENYLQRFIATSALPDK